MIEKIKARPTKVLPLTFDESLSYYEVLCQLTEKINECLTKVNLINPEEIHEEITALAEELQSVVDEFSSAITDINDVKDDVTELKTDMTGVNTDITSIESDIASLQSSVALLQSVIGSATGDLSLIEAALASINSDIDALEEDISDIQGDITNLQSSINTVAGSVTTLQLAVTNNTNSINAINGEISDINTAIENIDTDIGNAKYLKIINTPINLATLPSMGSSFAITGFNPVTDIIEGIKVQNTVSSGGTTETLDLVLKVNSYSAKADSSTLRWVYFNVISDNTTYAGVINCTYSNNTWGCVCILQPQS